MALGLTIERGNHEELPGIKRSLADVGLVCLGRLAESDAAREPAYKVRKAGCFQEGRVAEGTMQGAAAGPSEGQYNPRKVVANSDGSP